MKKCLPLLIGAALLSFISTSFAEVGKKVTFPSFDSGHIYGEKISADDLRGKVVFFEYWGLQCPPCRAAMPHLIELQKKYGNKGFVVIGSHVQFMSAAVTEYLKENKVNFPIYQHKSLPEAPCPGGIPFSVLVGADGRIVAEGMPSQVYGAVEEAVAKVAKGFPILDGVQLKKYKALEKTLVSNGTNVEGKVEELREDAKGGDTEAQAICDAYDAWLANEKQRITRQCESNPLQAVKSVAQLKKAVPSVTEFDEQVQAFKEEPVYQKLAAVQKKINGIQKRQASGKRVTPGPLKGLKKALEEIRGMEGVGVAALCDSMEADIDAMADSVESSRESKKDKKGKKSKKGKRSGDDD